MVHEFRHQPFRSLFLTYQFITTTFIRLPFWIIILIPNFLRPRRGWSLRRAVQIRLLKHVMYVAAKVGRAKGEVDHLALVEGVKGVWVDPVPEKLIVDEVKAMAVTAHVQPVRLPGYWFHRDGTHISVGQRPTTGEKVLYHFHGGGYTDFSANPNDPLTAPIASGFLDNCEVIQRVFALEYRLSLGAPHSPTNPFPSALLDALTGYYYLLDVVGFAPEDIIVEGDSAGGNLALALTRYLAENQNRTDVQFPGPPGGLVLLSPWSDLSPSHEGPGSSFETCSADILFPIDLQYKKEAFTGPFGLTITETNPYISPVALNLRDSVSFKGFPRTFIAGGGAEIFKDQIRTLKETMAKDMGEGDGQGQITYHEAPNAIHDYIVSVWHEPERTDTLKRIARWMAV